MRCLATRAHDQLLTSGQVAESLHTLSGLQFDLKE